MLIALLLPTIYSSSAVVMLDPRKNNVTDVSAVLAQLAGDPATLQNQIQISPRATWRPRSSTKLQLYRRSRIQSRAGRRRAWPTAAIWLRCLNPANWFEDGRRQSSA